MQKYFTMIFLLTLVGCSQKRPVDLIIYNARVYTVDSFFTVAESFAVKEGNIIAVGKQQDILNHYEAAQKLDAEGMFVYPGFIDAHCHFFNYGLGKQQVDLTGTASFAQVLEKLKEFYDTRRPEWLTGRGWDQNDWDDKRFPDNTKLDDLFPEVPVLIRRIDGHAALANSAALRIAGITEQTRVEGGQIIIQNGKLTGVLIDNAVDLVSKCIPEPSEEQRSLALTEAEKDCFALGLTMVADAGLDKETIMLMEKMQKSGKLKIYVYAMLNPTKENFDHFMKSGVYATDRLSVRSLKLYADGALGSRGACLLAPYSDDPGNHGIMVDTRENLEARCREALKHGYQVNIHAIGDSGVRTVLGVFAAVLGGANDQRWRVEHAQCVAPGDFSLFGKYNIIPSVQPTHATSDMLWAKDRLGEERVKTAYAYKQLLEQNGWIPFGTDFPIEKVDPLLTFYAAVFRMDAEGFPEGGWQVENAVTREQALKAMTIWAARSCFAENERGSLEPGKSADFIMLDRDIMKSSPDEVLRTSVLKTYVAGEEVYSK